MGIGIGVCVGTPVDSGMLADNAGPVDLCDTAKDLGLFDVDASAPNAQHKHRTESPTVVISGMRRFTRWLLHSLPDAFYCGLSSAVRSSTCTRCGTSLSSSPLPQPRQHLLYLIFSPNNSVARPVNQIFIIITRVVPRRFFKNPCIYSEKPTSRLDTCGGTRRMATATLARAAP